MPVKPISKERFEALCRSRLPAADYISKEVEWFADEDERVLGVILLDLQDNDWVSMVLGRDEENLFRAIDLEVSIQTRDKAREVLLTKLDQYSRTGETIFPQFDNKGKKFDPIIPVVERSRLHQNFLFLVEGDGHSAARDIIRELAYAFIDVDGNFVKDFQTTGFNARLWELYLNAFLYEQRFSLLREFDRPDFCALKAGFPVGIEAVTVNPTAGENPLKPKDKDELRLLQQEYMPIKFGSALFSKLQKRYWELPHMKGMPLILAVHDFYVDDSMTWSAPGIDDYLFGLRAKWFKDNDGKLHIEEEPIFEHTWGTKKIPSGFFNQPDVEHVSAVLFSNCATLSKFDRMGKLAGFGCPDSKMLRVGAKHDFDPNATEPIPFSVEVKPGIYQESWSDGVRIYHNPHAKIPVSRELFPDCSHHFLRDGRRIQFFPKDKEFVHFSHTIVIQPTHEGEGRNVK